jgi:hypothetical protein
MYAYNQCTWTTGYVACWNNFIVVQNLIIYNFLKYFVSIKSPTSRSNADSLFADQQVQDAGQDVAARTVGVTPGMWDIVNENKMNNEINNWSR